MNTYTLPSLSIPLEDGFDVLVAGGGPAGCAAAAAAARAGARTILLERGGALGGMGTLGLVPAWCPGSDGVRTVYGGLAREVRRRATAALPFVDPDDQGWTPIDAEALKRVYDDLLEEAGAEVRFETLLADVRRGADGRVDAVVAADKTGLRAFRAKAYVDATGDADLASRAGAETVTGDGRGGVQASTLCFHLDNVDTCAFEHQGSIRYGKEPRCIDAIVASPKYPRIDDDHACANLVGPAAVGLNAGHLRDVDATDPRSTSPAYREGRRFAREFRDALREHFPAAFGNARIAATAPALGIRESRRIVGDYVLTREDYVARRSFPDEISRNCYYLDIHDTHADGTVRHDPVRYGRGESHGIPYRCLVPRGLSDVLVAGRCISTDREVQGSTRVMPDCLCTGEAAGLAAAMAARLPVPDVRAVDVAVLRAALRAHGAYLP